MDRTCRIIVKAVSWQLMGLVTMTIINYSHIGSIWGSISLAATASVSGFIFFLIHEKIWNTVRWGRKRAIPVKDLEVPIGAAQKFLQ